MKPTQLLGMAVFTIINTLVQLATLSIGTPLPQTLKWQAILSTSLLLLLSNAIGLIIIIYISESHWKRGVTIMLTAAILSSIIILSAYLFQ